MSKPKTIAEALQRELDRRQVSHRSVAATLDVSQQSFSRWVNGETRPTADRRDQVARFLGLKLADYDALWAASKRPRGGVKTADRLRALESRVDSLERLVIQVAARVQVEP